MGLFLCCLWNLATFLCCLPGHLCDADQQLSSSDVGSWPTLARSVISAWNVRSAMMRLQEIKMSVLHQRDLNKARRVAQRAFSFRRAAYHYEYLDWTHFPMLLFSKDVMPTPLRLTHQWVLWWLVIQSAFLRQSWLIAFFFGYVPVTCCMGRPSASCKQHGISTSRP